MGAPLAVAVVGPGHAGRARIASLEAHPDTRVAATVARSGAPSLEEVLADPGVDAVVVCTPNLAHAEQVEAALRAGKHVAVEYPLAPDAERARTLFELARERKRVLHVEHIELLSPTQADQRERVARLGQPRGGVLTFKADLDGWIADSALAGSPALRALARLHRLLDLFGEASVEWAEQKMHPDGAYRLEAGLVFDRGGHAMLIERRGPGVIRVMHWDVPCERGILADPPLQPVRGLFARDLDCFVARIREGARGYVSEPRILHALDLVSQIEDRLR